MATASPPEAVKPAAQTTASWSRGKVLAASVGAAAACTIALAVGLGVGLPNTAVPPPQQPQTPHAVVLVSGFHAPSPFTTPALACQPTANCGTGCFTAGNTDSYLRERLLAAGYAVYTAPAMPGGGRAVSNSEWGGFQACAAEPLPEWMTSDPDRDPELCGVRVAAFINYLQATYGVQSVDLVGHSMGGLFSRAAIKELALRRSTVRIRSLHTIGSPWWGGVVWANMYFGTQQVGVPGFFLTPADCQGDVNCTSIYAEEEKAYDTDAGIAISPVVLAGPWFNGVFNAQQAGQLAQADAAVHLYVGTFYSAPNRTGFVPDAPYGPIWPHDGLPQAQAVAAVGIPPSILPPSLLRFNKSYPDVHSAFVANVIGLPLSAGLTWDPAVADDLIANLNKLPAVKSK